MGDARQPSWTKPSDPAPCYAHSRLSRSWRSIRASACQFSLRHKVNDELGCRSGADDSSPRPSRLIRHSMLHEMYPGPFLAETANWSGPFSDHLTAKGRGGRGHSRGTPFLGVGDASADLSAARAVAAGRERTPPLPPITPASAAPSAAPSLRGSRNGRRSLTGRVASCPRRARALRRGRSAPP